jgi:hypothetical protein
VVNNLCASVSDNGGCAVPYAVGSFGEKQIQGLSRILNRRVDNEYLPIHFVPAFTVRCTLDKYRRITLFAAYSDWFVYLFRQRFQVGNEKEISLLGEKV